MKLQAGIKSPGLGQSQAGPSQSQHAGPGSRFLQAKPGQSRPITTQQPGAYMFM